MRILGLLLALTAAVAAGDPVSDDMAQEALLAFEKEFKTKDVEQKQNAVYNLHDVPHDVILKRLEKVMRDRDPRVRNVAALAMGGQSHDVPKAGGLLMKFYKRDYKNTEVLSSILEGIAELRYMGYWPTVQKALKDERNSVVIRVMELLGVNKDWRALPELLEMYKVAMPKRVTWKTGEVTVDTGTAGDADQKAAEAKFNAKYGRGGSKAKAKAKRKAAAFDERNFDAQLRRCVKAITGETFDNAFDFEDWYVENYLTVVRKMAEMDGKDPEPLLAKAKTDLVEMKRKLEEERKKIEEELAKERENAGG